MREITHDELAQHALGIANAETSRMIELRAARDPEIAAQLDVLRSVSGLVHPERTEEKKPIIWNGQPVRASRNKWFWRIAAGGMLLWLSGGLAWASWKWLSPKPLLADDFASNWGDRQLWETPRRIVKVEGGHVRLFDRGMLVTREEFKGPIDLRFRWRWIDLTGDFLYRDALTVGLRTSGIPKNVRPWDTSDGIIVELIATNGQAVIARKSSDPEAEALAATPVGWLPLPAEQWFDVRITDDGETISLYVSGPGAKTESSTIPVLQAKVGASDGPHRIAFYNRERLASASHESWIDDVVIDVLKQ